MSIALRNTQRRMQVFNLRHDLYCEASGRCGCSEQTVTTLDENPMSGERRPRSVLRKVPAALTLLALETQEGLHEAVLKVPEIKRAVDGGALRVLTPTPRAQPKTTPTPDPKSKKDKERDTDK